MQPSLRLRIYDCWPVMYGREFYLLVQLLILRPRSMPHYRSSTVALRGNLLRTLFNHSALTTPVMYGSQPYVEVTYLVLLMASSWLSRHRQTLLLISQIDKSGATVSDCASVGSQSGILGMPRLKGVVIYVAAPFSFSSENPCHFAYTGRNNKGCAFG